MNTIIGMYDDLSIAEQVVQDLKDNGISQSNLHLATYDSRARNEGSGGFFESLSNLFGSTPRSVGGSTKNMAQQMQDWGVSEGDSQQFAEAVRRGNTMVLANVDDDQTATVRQIMGRYDPIDVQQRASQWQQQGWTGYDQNAAPYTNEQATEERQRFTSKSMDRGKRTLPVTEEELQVGKREVQRGGVRVYQRVSERPVEENINLRDETVHVDRQKVNRPASPEDLDAFQEGSFDVTETDEEAVVNKRANVVEEVNISKDVEERQETIRDTLRRTDVETEDIGATSRRDDFDTFEPEFRNHYETTYSRSGYDYSRYQPAYRYGYDLASSRRYQGRDWNTIEPDVRRQWEQDHPQDAWDQYEDAVYQGWNTVSSRG